MQVHATEVTTARLASPPGRPPEVAVEARGLSTTLELPASLGGRDHPSTVNPEQLFGGAYAGCFTFAVDYVARRAKADVTGLRCQAEVRVGRRRGGDMGNDLEVDLVVELPAVPQAEAEELCRRATRYCPFHRAIDGNVAATMVVRGRDA
jgi:osmotically inducible protein OsmC